MYRKIYMMLRTADGTTWELVSLKYGLEDGVKRSNKTVSERMLKKHPPQHGDTWNVATVAAQLKDVLEYLNCEELDQYCMKIKTYLQ